MIVIYSILIFLSIYIILKIDSRKTDKEIVFVEESIDRILDDNTSKEDLEEMITSIKNNDEVSSTVKERLIEEINIQIMHLTP